MAGPATSARSARADPPGRDPMRALIVCDMLNDFVSGALANPRSERIIPNIQDLLARARAANKDWLVAYVNDAHLPGDVELDVWGEHAMAGTPGEMGVVH